MKRKLKNSNLYYYYKNGKKIYGKPNGVIGNLKSIWGDLSGVRGDLDGVWGDVSDIYGDLTGVYGDLRGVWGDLDECEITEEDRKKGINIEDLIKE